MKSTFCNIKISRLSKIILAPLCFLLIFGSSAFALDLNLAWNANNDQSVAGYKLYYQANSRNLAIDSPETIPVVVGNQTSTILSGLPDNQVYYFAVSAYDQTGNESPLSNIIANGWTPSLIAPEQGTNQNGTSYVTFIWDTAPSNYSVSYTLYYGTDPKLNAAIAPATKPFTSNDPPLALGFILSVVTGLIFGRKKFKLNFAVAGSLLFGLIVAGCGGGGGGSLASGTTPGDPVVAQQQTTAVVVGKADYLETYDLKPATTYYWKVVATDDNNPALKYESETFTFTN